MTILGQDQKYPQNGTYPERLTSLPQWVVVGPDKIPLQPATRRRADTTDPTTWSPYATAARAADTHRLNLGFVFTKASGIVGIDLDKCRDPETGIIEPWALSIVQSLNTLTEISFSGTGLHLLAEGELPDGRRKKGQIEMYDAGRHFLMTGNLLPGYDTLRSRPAAITRLHQDVFVEPDPAPRPAAPSTPLTRDSETILSLVEKTTKGRQLLSGDMSSYPSQSEADQALTNLYVAAGADRSQADDLFRRSVLFREKWDQRRGAKTYGEKTLDKAFDGSVRLWSDNTAAGGTNGQDADLLDASLPNPDDLPDDIPSLKRLIVDLMRRQQADQRRIEAAEQRAIDAGDRAERLSLLQSRTMAAFRSHGLGSEKATGVALAFEIANQQAADPTLTEFPICNIRLAQQTGVSESTIVEHTKGKLPQLVDTRTGEIVELFERKVRFVRTGVDPATGEQSDPKAQVVYIPKIDPLAMLDVFANAVPLSRKAKNNHGGKSDRGRLCPDHPNADVVKRVTYHCAECDRKLDEETPVTLPNQQDAHSVPPANNDQHDVDPYAYGAAGDRVNGQDAHSVSQIDHVVNHYRVGKSLTHHNAAPSGSVAEAFLNARPMPGFEPTPLDPYTDVTRGGRP